MVNNLLLIKEINIFFFEYPFNYAHKFETIVVYSKPWSSFQYWM